MVQTGDGGIALYLHESLVYEERLDISTNVTSNYDCLFADVQIVALVLSPLMLSTVHRTPMSIL